MTATEQRTLVVVVTRVKVSRGGNRDEWCVEWGLPRDKDFESRNASWTASTVLLLHGCEDNTDTERLLDLIGSALATPNDGAGNATDNSFTQGAVFTHGLSDPARKDLATCLCSRFCSQGAEVKDFAYGTGGIGGVAVESLAKKIKESGISGVDLDDIVNRIREIASGPVAWIARLAQVRDWLLRIYCNVSTLHMVNNDAAKQALADEAFNDICHLVEERRGLEKPFTLISRETLNLPNSVDTQWKMIHDLAVGISDGLQAMEFWSYFLAPASGDSKSPDQQAELQELRTVAENVTPETIGNDLRRLGMAVDVLVDELQRIAGNLSIRTERSLECADGE